MNNKINYGQYFTKSNNWLYPQIIKFIKNKSILDPFAGNGDIFKTLKEIGLSDFKGFDIDKSLLWPVNDSLKNIPQTNRMIITNPPYLAKNSANRKNHEFYKYFKSSEYTDLYQIALNKMLKTHDDIIAIIPETFINNVISEHRLRSITIVEDNLFSDTDCPVCIVCYCKKSRYTKIYKGSEYCCTLKQLKKYTKVPKNTIGMIFNDKDGNIGLRAIDGVNNDNIRFCTPNKLNYPLDKISNKSRAITLIKVENPYIIKECNKILKEYRKNTHDLLLSPFKGNKNNGIRRRRLDYKTARAIIEEATYNVSK